MGTHDIDRIIRERVESRRFRIKDVDQLKTVDDVFNQYTIDALRELMNRRVVDEVYGPVAQGKEAKVIWAKAPDGTDIALKIFYTSTAQFIRGRYKYLLGDPRFTGVKITNTRKLIEYWCRKEFSNLGDAYNAGVRVPKPITFNRNILVMEFISYRGVSGVPAPLIKDAPPEDPESAYLTIIKYIEKAFILGRIIHADLSEFNIVNTGDELVIIDWGSAVKTNHPNAVEFLLRDIENINRYFNKELHVKTLDGKALLNALLRRYEYRGDVKSDEDGWLLINDKRIIDDLTNV
ncbi:serine protein kinase RIO [Vulcanisaeta distributa]|uniref:non-specific serine/threonine protein kinase n=1 Tax=Vulcanisaeta distributa (strain DSM 14429 / JCM 11212 / NBRC 100878 / IC-017) TaxID=572478 RepID=E1QQM9_VULDI|nr:serine protein kinase RIO [Vulcanisaeta distributa]ADN51641.1 RIO-like kinase [Vulcanisaeta distributa DSM 14429]